MKKFVISLIILIILGGVVFYFGWIQFRIPEGSYAVVFTKTGGYEDRAIAAGEFAWRWEALLPTNLTLHTYSAEPFTASLRSSGSLPSADLYGRQLEGPSSFDYSLSAEVRYRFDPERLPELLAEEIVDPQGLVSWYERREEQIRRQLLGVVSDNLSELAEAEEIATVSAELSEMIEAELAEIYPYLSITSVVLTELELPDLRLYRAARDLYFTELDSRREALRTSGVEAASEELRQESRVARLEQYGEVLADYPSLLEYFNLLAQNGVDPLNIQELGIRLPPSEVPAAP
jgi:hypothetical protein